MIFVRNVPPPVDTGSAVKNIWWTRGEKLLKIVLDEKERGGVDYRLDTYSEVYKRLTGKGVNFEFPQSGAGEY